MALQLEPVPVVWGITGNLGGGKSLTAVCLAAVAMARGYYVVSNITLNLDELAAEFGQHVRRLYTHFSFDDPGFDPFALPTGSPRGSGGKKRVLVIMDECAEWVDQYSSVNSDPRIKRFLSWLRHSSKRSQDVILVVQRLDYLNKNIRLLISKWVVVDDLRVWRMPIVKARVPFMSGFVMQRVFDRNRKLVQGPCIVNKAAFGRFYNTAECLNATGASINNEYGMPTLNSYPWSGHVLLYVLSLLLLLSAVFKYLSQVERLDSRPPGEAMTKASQLSPGRTRRVAHAVRSRSGSSSPGGAGAGAARAEHAHPRAASPVLNDAVRRVVAIAPEFDRTNVAVTLFKYSLMGTRKWR